MENSKEGGTSKKEYGQRSNRTKAKVILEPQMSEPQRSLWSVGQLVSLKVVTHASVLW